MNPVPRLTVLFFLAILADSLLSAPDANAIMERSDVVGKVVGSAADLTMTLTNATGQERVRQLISLTHLQANGRGNQRLLRFTHPADIKGTVTLLIEHRGSEDDMWIYLPAMKKVRRLVATNKRDSFVGSDLSFGDIIGHPPADWHHAWVREESLDGTLCDVIESTPKSDAVRSNTGYGKLLSWIARVSHLSLRTDYWDESGVLLKTIRASNVRQVDAVSDKWQFMRLEGVNHQTKHRTLLVFNRFEVRSDLPEAAFLIGDRACLEYLSPRCQIYKHPRFPVFQKYWPHSQNFNEIGHIIFVKVISTK
ncbi:exported hypothetical protein [Gammaproteobacteria bacterium]